MDIVFLTALGVGGATVIGAILGFLFKNISHKFSDAVLGFAAGVMLNAAVIGLILSSIEKGREYIPNGDIWALPVTVLGILCGAVTLNLIDKLVPHLHRLTGKEPEAHPTTNPRTAKIMLFVLAIAIHNFPEGIAAGVGFGTGTVADGLTIAGGIALQNIPEGMVIIAPMLSAGIGKGKTFLIAAATGLIEVIGTFIGYFAVSITATILPFALAFAGGTMIYIISDEMIPETHSHGCERAATYALIIGFCLMLAVDFYIGG